MANYVIATNEPKLDELGNAIVEAVNAAVAAGLDMDDACSVLVCVAGDLWRAAFEDPAEGLAACLEDRGGVRLVQVQ